MAEVVVGDDDVVVALTAFERAESLHADVRVPRAAVAGAEVLDDPVAAVRGLKLVGSRLPGVLAVGTFVEASRRWFVVVHHGTPRGVRITLRGAHHDGLVVGCDDPEAVVAALGSHR